VARIRFGRSSGSCVYGLKLEFADFLCKQIPRDSRQKFRLEIQGNMTIYKIDYSAVAVKPEVVLMSLKRLVGSGRRFSEAHIETDPLFGQRA
jgi:hypothetical protein